MKTFGLLLLAFTFMFSMHAAVQEAWSVGFEDVDWIENDHNTRGAAFNPDSGNVIVVSRTPEAAVKVLDGSNGDFIKDLDPPAGGYDGGEFVVTKVKVSQDGIIFVSNLSVAGDEGKVYIWQNEEDDSPAVLELTDAGNRIGDQVGIGEDEDFIYFIVASHLAFDEEDLLKNFVMVTYDKSDSSLTDDLIPFEVRNADNRLYSINYDAENDVIYGTGGWWNPPMDFYHNDEGTYVFNHSTQSFGMEQSAISNLLEFEGVELAFRAPMHVWPTGGVYLHAFVDADATTVPGAEFTQLADYPLSTHSSNFNSNGNYAYEVELFDLDEDYIGVMVMVTNNFVKHYSISKQEIRDIIDPPPPPEPLIEENWSIAAGDVDWFENDNNTRGASFNPDTGNIILVSRTGTPAVKVLDGATGAVIKDLAEPAGGFVGGHEAFPVSKVKVSRDGIIFVSNLTVDGEEAKVYVWQDEDDDDPASYEAQNVGNRTGDQAAIAEDDDYIYYITGWDLGDPSLRNFVKYTYDKNAGEIVSDELLTINYIRRNFSLNYDLENDRLYGTTGWNPEIDTYHNDEGTYTHLNNSGSFGGFDHTGSNLFYLEDDSFYQGRTHQLIASAPMRRWSNIEDLQLYAFLDGFAGSAWMVSPTLLEERPISVPNDNGNFCIEIELFDLDDDTVGIFLMITNNLIGMYSIPKSMLIELSVEDWSLYTH